MKVSLPFQPFMAPDPNVAEILAFLKEERSLNNSRFTQVSTGIMDVRKEIARIKTDMSRLEINLTGKIDKVFDSLSRGIQVFAEDLGKITRRVEKVERKVA